MVYIALLDCQIPIFSFIPEFLEEVAVVPKTHCPPEKSSICNILISDSTLFLSWIHIIFRRCLHYSGRAYDFDDRLKHVAKGITGYGARTRNELADNISEQGRGNYARTSFTVAKLGSLRWFLQTQQRSSSAIAAGSYLYRVAYV